jgi:hypothetical protein
VIRFGDDLCERPAALTSAEEPPATLRSSIEAVLYEFREHRGPTRTPRGRSVGRSVGCSQNPLACWNEGSVARVPTC